ncbi:MAG TPA: hypothetical protein VMC41_03735 [Candidatus Nanoarchaeia archaeon]|nr:hypothetical protein [Candidatus Nanoarchaeia archaeon]
MLSKKITRGLPNLTKNFKPRGPDRMGQPSRALHFGVIKAEGNPKVIAQRVRKIYIKALAAKKKAGR